MTIEMRWIPGPWEKDLLQYRVAEDWWGLVEVGTSRVRGNYDKWGEWQYIPRWDWQYDKEKEDWVLEKEKQTPPEGAIYT